MSDSNDIVIKIKEEPTYKDAAEACIAWFDAESKGLGTFHQRMDLCKYSEWACRKANGEDLEEFKGVPQIILKFL